jgi:hypothetical protein
MTWITDACPALFDLDLDLMLKGTCRLVEVCDCRLDLRHLPPRHVSPHFLDPKERCNGRSVPAIRVGSARWR